MGYNGQNRYEQIVFLSKGERLMPLDLGVPDVLYNKLHDYSDTYEKLLGFLVADHLPVTRHSLFFG